LIELFLIPKRPEKSYSGKFGPWKSSERMEVQLIYYVCTDQDAGRCCDWEKPERSSREPVPSIRYGHDVNVKGRRTKDVYDVQRLTGDM